MNHVIQNKQADQKNVNILEQAKKALAYNIIIPDYVILIMCITSGFAALLTAFS